MNKKLIIAGAMGLVAILWFGFSMTGSNVNFDETLLVDVKKGQFIVDITTTGELKAKNSVNIMGPSQLRRYRLWEVTIQSMIDEGTFVKKGDFVAQLDASELVNKINEAQIEFDKVQSQYIQTQLDTTLQMREARDELVNMEYEVQEKQLVLDQSQYEPPATIKKAEIDLAKSKRKLEQAKENYKIKKNQNAAKMDEISATRRKQSLELDGMNALRKEFLVMAPEDGMIIYHKNWDGVVKQGGRVRAWDPIVATLPDLSVMVSETFVNEVDIRKIAEGQSVELGLDAFPEKKMTGKVIKVSNVGEQRPNSDAKVFQVSIELDGTDDLIKPAMTTSNRIITQAYEEALYIPLECLNTQSDSITFVYKKNGSGFEKQEVKLGKANSNEVVVLSGLELNDKVYLTKIDEMAEEEVKLLPELDGKRNQEESKGDVTMNN